MLATIQIKPSTELYLRSLSKKSGTSVESIIENEVEKRFGRIPVLPEGMSYQDLFFESLTRIFETGGDRNPANTEGALS